MLNKRIMKTIMAHAESEYPRECCGLVVLDGKVQKYLHFTNVHPDPLNCFAMDEKEYLKALSEYDVIRVIHSHPGDGARAIPSQADKACCDEQGITWGIVSWPEGDYAEFEPELNKPLLGRPFVLGRNDCYGLVIEWHRQQGIALLDFRVPYPWWERGESRFCMENFKAAGFELSEPVAGCMIVAQVQAPVPNHSAVLIGDGQAIHHLFGQLSTRVQYSGSWLQERTVFCVRHKDLPPPEDLKPWQ